GGNGRVLTRVVDVTGNLFERPFVDHRAHEVPEVAHVSHLYVVDHGDHLPPDTGPHRARNVETAGRRALLPLELEGASHRRHRQRRGVGRWVRDDEILPAGFADDARVGTIAG